MTKRTSVVALAVACAAGGVLMIRLLLPVGQPPTNISADRERLEESRRSRLQARDLGCSEPDPRTEPSADPIEVGESLSTTQVELIVDTELARIQIPFPIEDETLRRRVLRQARLSALQYRKSLALSSDQLRQVTRLVFHKTLGDFEDSRRIPEEIRRVKSQYADLVRREDFGPGRNDLDVYRKLDPELDRLLSGGRSRYIEFARSVRAVLEERQRRTLDASNSLIVR
jgi:hypothetical protein